MNRLQRTALSFVNWLIPTDDKIKDNKDIIMKQLYSTDFIPLSTAQSIELFREVEREFVIELNRRHEFAQEEIKVITQYFSV